MSSKQELSFSDGESCGSATSQVFYDTRRPISNLRARLSISYDRHHFVDIVVVVFSLGPSDLHLLDAIKTLDAHLARALASCKCCSASSRRLALLVTSLDAFVYFQSARKAHDDTNEDG